eukprot:scaffold275727_cov27-Tisochrysis_lutea.AAC.2
MRQRAAAPEAIAVRAATGRAAAEPPRKLGSDKRSSTPELAAVSPKRLIGVWMSANGSPRSQPHEREHLRYSSECTTHSTTKSPLGSLGNNVVHPGGRGGARSRSGRHRRWGKSGGSCGDRHGVVNRSLSWDSNPDGNHKHTSDQQGHDKFRGMQPRELRLWHHAECTTSFNGRVRRLT